MKVPQRLQFLNKGRHNMRSRKKFLLLAISALVTLTFLVGCGGRVYAPRDGSAIWYYHPELPEAAKAVEDAQKAGKDAVCPDEFQAAKKLMDDAYHTYWACKTEEAIKMAKEATAKAKSLCPPPAACSLTASPQEIQKGQSSTLTFTTSGTVKSAMLDGVEVPITGVTKTVSPSVTTTYTGQCTGIGGTRATCATVTVTSPPTVTIPPMAPAAPEAQAQPKVIDKMTLRIQFDFDRYQIRHADEAELQKAVKFVKDYPNCSVKIEGHTDSFGSNQYNQKLSERRAGAVGQYFIQNGAVKKENVSTVGYGKSRPIADNNTFEGREENRRVEILILK
jgi:OmpA-OmpF porin, OOP family